jgi:hypothetical protein
MRRRFTYNTMTTMYRDAIPSPRPVLHRASECIHPLNTFRLQRHQVGTHFTCTAPRPGSESREHRVRVWRRREPGGALSVFGVTAHTSAGCLLCYLVVVRCTLIQRTAARGVSQLKSFALRYNIIHISFSRTLMLRVPVLIAISLPPPVWNACPPPPPTLLTAPPPPRPGSS